jgi:hypothetical protein
MGIVTLILTAFQGIGVLAGNQHINLGQVNELLATLARLVQIGGATHLELKNFTEAIERMVAEDRGPNDMEWANLKARSNAAHARLQAAKADILADD